MTKESRIYIAGHTGLLGSAIVRALKARSYKEIVYHLHAQCDLTDRAEVDRLMWTEQPDYVFLCAGKVGGIRANATQPADFIYRNLAIQTNVIDSACRHGVMKLLFCGSSCIYPRLAPQPIREDALLSGPLEPTNASYAVAKIAGIQMARAYWEQYKFPVVCTMFTNLYGPGDHFSSADSHVVPALIRRFHEAAQRNAPSVRLWGTGTERREFLHVDDAADAAVFLMERDGDPEIVNVGTGDEVSINELACLIAGYCGYSGIIEWDGEMDGTPRKLLDTTRMSGYKWHSKIDLNMGLKQTCRWYANKQVRIVQRVGAVG